MKKNIFISVFLVLGYIGYSQNYERQIFDYSQMPEKDYIECNSEVISDIDIVYSYIEDLQSKSSTIIAKKIFDKSENKCPLL